MSKKQEPGMAYDMSKLNKIFAFLSVGLLITTFWVFLDDYIRPWKAVQLEAMQIRRGKLQEKVEEAKKAIDQEKLAELQAQLAEGEEAAKQRQAEIAALEVEINKIDKDIKEETITNGRLNSMVSATTFKYEIANSHGDSNAKELLATLHDYKEKFEISRDRMKGLEATIKAKNKKLDSLRAEIIQAEKGITETTRVLDLLKISLAKTDVTPVFAVRNAPFLDFLDPTLKIQQLVIDKVEDDRYFVSVPKVDRCITCHTFIDQEGYEDQPNPHRTHPNLELMVGTDSKHPMKQFGCTSCHGGEGHRVHDFNSAAHIPQNDEQKAEWIEKYNWHEPHKIPQPMFKLQHTEASCVKCHQGVEHLPGAAKLNEGWDKIEEFGCYACHKIEGWEHKRTPGPSLEKISSKVSKEFFKNWVWSPKAFNTHAKMPSFFAQSNNSKDEFMEKNVVEVNAITEYVWDKAQDYKPFAKYQGGNKERGKELIKEVGCMGCHGVEGYEAESKKVGAYAGPFLTGTGSKVKSADWLMSWLIKPSHYQEDTIMPSFRLSDREANDITAYLMSLKNKKFEKLKFEELNKDLRDELLVEYFAAFDTLEVSAQKVAAMSDREKTLELGYRSIGKYGCYSCHNIEGFDGRAGIGPELTKEGSKPLTQFGFNQQHDIEHSRDGWIKAHLINPRRWDGGLDKPFKDLTRMPNYYMTEKEADSITLAVLGQVADEVPLKGIKRLNAHEKLANEGMKVVNKYSCVGCHSVDGWGGKIVKMYDDTNEAPPQLNMQGFRVQSDWLYHFLGNVQPIRPWLKIRMPSFNLSTEEKNKIVTGFQAKSSQPTFVANDEKVEWEPGERAAAVKLFEALACTSCHTTGFNKDQASAPNLHKAKPRLRPDWMEAWLHNPQKFVPGTVMPSFWEGGESLEADILGGDADKQVKALVKYILEIGENETRSPMRR
tara:strand:+ start:2386 stop:5208 length:2823 start_codon:yes stop_codon:yes gene_type:complete